MNIPCKLLPLSIVRLLALTCVCCLSTAPLVSYGGFPASQPSEERYEVETFKDITFYDGPDNAGSRHMLDLYVPLDTDGDFPVLHFVYGSAWNIPFTKEQVIPLIGSYQALGEGLASRGIGVVIANHRVDQPHPAHIIDVARAWAWIYENIESYGGDNSRMFLLGHSSGAHLAALLAANHSYLEDLEVPVDSIKGVIGMGGVYQVSGGVFGNDPEVWAQASPINFVDSDLPPFMLVLGSRDIPLFWREAIPFARELHANGVLYGFNIMWGQGHITSIGQIGREGERITGKIEEFIKW